MERPKVNNLAITYMEEESRERSSSPKISRAEPEYRTTRIARKMVQVWV